ncbi:MAG: DUF3810 domain-containing protein [Lachnospiraceae bacterium]|nr:DUF3810 domain-containing protein [Lachnospiraceae bacterium]
MCYTDTRVEFVVFGPWWGKREGGWAVKVLKRKRLFLLLLFPLSFLITALAKRSVFFAEEVFAKRIYKVHSVVVSAVTGWIPFSLAEFIVVAGPVVCIVLLIRFIVHIVKEKEDRFARCLLGIINAACVAAVILFVYVIGCGVNYHRVSIADYRGITVRDSSKEELYGLCIELAEQAVELRTELTKYEDEDGVLRLPVSNRELGKQVQQAYEMLSEDLPVLRGMYPAPKCITSSKVFSSMEITGVFTCWTMEANVNVDIPDYSRASTMAHELAHLHGFMREDEANFLAYLACMSSDDPVVRYSGTMLALIYAGNALAGQDMELYGELWATYHEGMGRDFRDNSAYWDQYHDTVISETVDKVNDVYLKANEQEDGVKSYGRVVDLLLAEYREKHGLK